MVSKYIATALENAGKIEDFVPADFLQKYNLTDLNTALHQIHFPTSSKGLERAAERLSRIYIRLSRISLVSPT